MNNALKNFLDAKVKQYNTPAFIKDDPVCIPHLFTKKQDIEIAGFFAAIFAWGNRTIIINKSKELMRLMDDAPHEFVTTNNLKELQHLLHFKHRTFNTTDLLYFIEFLRQHYNKYASLEAAFTIDQRATDWNAETALINFREYFFSLQDHPLRTRKHIASPAKNSNCKRLNMFLRWMVRKDKQGVDFGIWKMMKPSQLVCPVDVHVARVAKKLGLLQRKQIDWQAAIELTEHLKKFDKHDPVKYDFALFGLGVIEKYY